MCNINKLTQFDGLLVGLKITSLKEKSNLGIFGPLASVRAEYLTKQSAVNIHRRRFGQKHIRLTGESTGIRSRTG